MWNLMNHLEQAGQHVAQLESAPDGWSRVWNCIILSNTHAQNRADSWALSPHPPSTTPLPSSHCYQSRIAWESDWRIRRSAQGLYRQHINESASLHRCWRTQIYFYKWGLKQCNIIYWGGPFSDSILWAFVLWWTCGRFPTDKLQKLSRSK